VSSELLQLLLFAEVESLNILSNITANVMPKLQKTYQETRSMTKILFQK
jgi:hypothetical protein